MNVGRVLILAGGRVYAGSGGGKWCLPAPF